MKVDRLRFRLKTLLVVTLLVIAYVGGWARRQPEIVQSQREVIQLRSELEIVSNRLQEANNAAASKAHRDAWRDDVIEYLQDQGLAPDEPANYQRIGRSGVETGMKFDALERRSRSVR